MDKKSGFFGNNSSGSGGNSPGQKNPFGNLGGKKPVGSSPGPQSTTPSAPSAPAKNPFEHYSHKNAAADAGSSKADLITPRTFDDYNKKAQATLNTPGQKPGEPAKPTTAVPEKVTSTNYQRIFAEKAVAEKAALEERDRLLREGGKKVNNDEEHKAQQKTLEEQRQADNYRARARDLQGQIAYWKQQLGQDPDLDNRANANIHALSQELGGIPGIYWT